MVSQSATRAAVESFQRAIETGDPQRLLEVLALEVVLMSDGGGIKQAALRPITGADRVVRYMLGGIGSPYGAMVGGLVIGLAVELGATYITADYSYSFAFVVLILVLIFRPRGLVGGAR